MSTPTKEDAMQYALFIYGGDGRWETFTEEAQQAMRQEYMAVGMDSKTQAGADPGELSKATTVRVQDGKPVTTDGPFAETKEYLGGFYLIEADNLDEAIETAARIPAARTGGAIEVRPVGDHCTSSNVASARSGAASSRPLSASSALSSSPRTA